MKINLTKSQADTVMHLCRAEANIFPLTSYGKSLKRIANKIEQAFTEQE